MALWSGDSQNDNGVSKPLVKTWHWARWPFLAWLETAVKLVALVIGINTLVVVASSAARLALPAGPRLVQLVLLALLSMGLTAAIRDRLIEREIVSMVFILLNNLGHWGMVLSLAAAHQVTVPLVPFAFFMLLGDLIKLLFLGMHKYSVRSRNWRVLSLLTSLYVAGYALLLILEFS